MLMSTGLLGRKSVRLQALDPRPQRQPGTQGALSPTLMGVWLFLFHLFCHTSFIHSTTQKMIPTAPNFTDNNYFLMEK